MAISRVRTTRRTPAPVNILRLNVADTHLRPVMQRRNPVIISGFTASRDLDLLPDSMSPRPDSSHAVIASDAVTVAHVWTRSD
ncbi:MAG: hypothetical protein P8O03_16120 [Ilumatobacter sp.]|nr:hypothetical protein [Ilumatobacter sp.]